MNAGLIWLAFACGIVSGYMLGTLLPPKAKAEEDDPPCVMCGQPADGVRWTGPKSFICLCGECQAEADALDRIEMEARRSEHE